MTDAVQVLEITGDDCWLRDTGPVFVRSKKNNCLYGIDFAFNAWGGPIDGCYSNWEHDSLVASKLLELLRIPRIESSLVLEGGSVTFDGCGTIIATEECLLNSNRNPLLSRKEIEEQLRYFLGAKKIIWLPFGVYGDVDTNGHVDNLCLFVGPSKVILHWTDDIDDPQYSRSKAALDILESEVDAEGHKFQVHKLHKPSPMFRTKEDIEGLYSNPNCCVARKIGEVLPASYVNLYIANRAVIVPSFEDKFDVENRQVLERIFPEREIVMIPAREILLGGGGIHCITCEVPSAD